MRTRQVNNMRTLCILYITRNNKYNISDKKKVSKKYGYFWSDQQDPDPLFY